MTDVNSVRPSILKFLNEQSGGQVAVDHEGNVEILESAILDSLSIVLLMEHLAETFNIEVADEDFEEENFATLESLCGFVNRKLSELA